MSEPSPARPAMVVEPLPTEEEAAAIAAAVYLELITTAVVESEGGGPSAESRWRFSGRWWN